MIAAQEKPPISNKDGLTAFAMLSIGLLTCMAATCLFSQFMEEERDKNRQR